MRGVEATRAYRQAQRTRSLRDQEADVFLRVNRTLRSLEADDEVGRARALADNDRMWTCLIDLMRDPGNALPAPLRGSVISVGLAVQRELATGAPDMAFLIAVNEEIAAGLAGM